MAWKEKKAFQLGKLETKTNKKPNSSFCTESIFLKHIFLPYYDTKQLKASFPNAIFDNIAFHLYLVYFQKVKPHTNDLSNFGVSDIPLKFR